MAIPSGLAPRLAAGMAAGGLGLTVALVGWFEGRSLVAYLDPIALPTICDGWTAGVRLGDVATHEECDELTQRATEEAERVLVRNVPAPVVDRLTAGQRAAFISFIYNVGPGGPGVKDGFVWLKIGRPSTMITLLRQGRIEDACRELPKWTRAGGKVLRGLERRRAAEMELCLHGI